jgi:hypothetical protein
VVLNELWSEDLRVLECELFPIFDRVKVPLASSFLLVPHARYSKCITTLISVCYWRNQGPSLGVLSVLTTETARMGHELSESSSLTEDSRVTESAAVRSVNSGFLPTQDLQYLLSLVLKGGLFVRYSFAQMRLTFSRKQIRAVNRVLEPIWMRTEEGIIISRNIDSRY